MKKILFASTALVATGLMTAGTASASEKIKLELGGYSKWWVVGQFNDDDYTRAAGVDYNTVDIKGDNEIFFGGETTLDNGMKVGVTIELEAGGVAVGNDRIDKSYAYVETSFGKIIIGSEANGTALLHVMAPDAAGNIDSDGILTGGLAINNPGTRVQVSTSIDTDGEAEKITYVAPTFAGLTVGASYIPSTSEDNRGVTNLKTQTASEIYGVGALYAREFGAVDLKVSGGWVTYDIENSINSATAGGVANAKTGVTEWSAGTQIAYNGFTVGGSYRKINGDEALLTNGFGADIDGRVWDAGVQYAQGPWAVSFYYFDSQQEDGAAADDDKFTVYQVSGKYSLGAGVDALATVGHAKYDDESSKAAGGDTNHNEGWAVMTGMALTF